MKSQKERTNHEDSRSRLHALVNAMPWTARLAVTLSLIFLMSEGLGLRELTSVLSGTPVPGWDFALAAPLAAFYVLGSFAFVALVPTLLLSALLSRALPSLWHRLRAYLRPRAFR